LRYLHIGHSTTPASDQTTDSSTEAVTTSIAEDQIEGFCSGKDASCHIEPTAAIVAKTEQV